MRYLLLLLLAGCATTFDCDCVTGDVIVHGNAEHALQRAVKYCAQICAEAGNDIHPPTTTRTPGYRRGPDGYAYDACAYEYDEHGNVSAGYCDPTKAILQ